MASITFTNPANSDSFIIELDGLDAEGYKTALALAIWKNASGAHVSTYCNACDHIMIGQQRDTCPECFNSEELEYADTCTEDELTVTDSEEVPDKYLTKGGTEDELTVTDSEEVPDKYLTKGGLDEDYFDFKDALEKSGLSYESFAAGVELDISLDNIEEAYQGEYRNDEEFAQEMADQIGAIDQDLAWPYTCIAWKRAAKELMQDYMEQDGYYFRSM